MLTPTFTEWVKCIFDHPVTNPAWHWADDADTCELPDELNVDYLTRLFTESDSVLREFDNAQVNQGLNLIAFSACSDHAFTIVAGDAPWPKRRACIRSIFDLYAKCFALRCEHRAVCERRETTNPLNYICYMWWDLFPARPDPNDASEAEASSEYLAVMERTLTLSHDACLEGALHGLGHWQSLFPERVEVIIDRFLRERADLRPELVLYARRARLGNVQ